MPTIVVFAAYGASVAVAALLLFFFHARAWYWHLLSVLAAMAVGLVRMPEGLRGPGADLTVGAVFLLLFAWGIGGPVVHAFHAHRQTQKQA